AKGAPGSHIRPIATPRRSRCRRRRAIVSCSAPVPANLTHRPAAARGKPVMHRHELGGEKLPPLSWLPAVPTVLPPVQLLLDSLPPPHNSASVGEGCNSVNANPAAHATAPASFLLPPHLIPTS